MSSEKARQLAAALFDNEAVRFGAFRLKLHERHPDAPLSPIYVDLRIVRSVPDLLSATVEVYEELIQGLHYDVFAEVPTAATPIVSVLAYKTRTPMITPRSETKSYGAVHRIEGMYERGKTALVLDDLITQADSKLEAISILSEHELIVRDVVVLLDREQGGAQRLMEEGYNLHSAFKLTDLLEFYLKAGTISREQFDKTISYLKNVPSI